MEEVGVCGYVPAGMWHIADKNPTAVENPFENRLQVPRKDHTVLKITDALSVSSLVIRKMTR